MTSADSVQTIIPARTRRQAMDWSLALISQGIESTIVQEGGGWQLLIPVQESERATGILEQYIKENRGRAWRQHLLGPNLIFHWGAAGWCFLVILFYWWNVVSLQQLRSAGAMDSAQVTQGEWWRFFTAMTLHADLAHLLANVTIGFVVLGLAMARGGAGCVLLFAWLAGAAGNLTGFLFYAEPYRGLGASGMVMGGLGLLAAQSLLSWRAQGGSSRLIVRGLLGGFLLFVLLGLDPASDVVAHLGGFAAGIAFGSLTSRPRTQFLRSSAASVVCGLILTALMIITWMFALV